MTGYFFMAKETYSELLRNPMWQKKRLEILEREDFTCQLCSDKETELQIHHKEYHKGKKPWQYENTNFQSLCKYCHKVVEDFKDKKLIAIIAAKTYEENIDCYRISTIFNSLTHGLIVAIHYCKKDCSEISLFTFLEMPEHKDLGNLFSHAEKLIT